MSYEEDRQFQQVVAEGLVPKIEESSIGVSVCPSPDKIDAKFCVELGVMIMLDKPIIAVIKPGEEVPRKLALVADRIVHADLMSDEGHAALMDAVNSLDLD